MVFLEAVWVPDVGLKMTSICVLSPALESVAQWFRPRTSGTAPLAQGSHAVFVADADLGQKSGGDTATAAWSTQRPSSSASNRKKTLQHLKNSGRQLAPDFDIL